MIFVKHLAQWSVPTLMETIAKVAVMALAAYVLPKSDFGVLTLAMLIYSFHPLLQLGIVDGLIIKLPGYYVQNRKEKISSSLGLSLTYALAIILLFLLIGIAFSLAKGQYDKTFTVCGIYLLTAIPYQVYNHYLLLNRYTYDLEVTFRARLFNAGLRLFVQAPLIYYYGIYGLVIGEVLIYSLTTIVLLWSSKVHVKLNFNFQHFKAYLIFGIPVWVLSLLSMLTVTLERSVSAYYFDIKLIADIGLLAFFGSLFMLVNGQILSLFTQYSREHWVKHNNIKSLVGAYFIYSLGALKFYIIIASFFYGIVALFIIPAYLPAYINIINFLPIMYAIFLLRIHISILFSLLLIIGDRINILIGYIIFFISTISVATACYIFSEFTFTTMLLSILVGVCLNFIFLLRVCILLTKHWVLGIWLCLTVLSNSSLQFYFFFQEYNSWLLIGFINFTLTLVISMFL